jgi:hypothetical protein
MKVSKSDTIRQGGDNMNKDLLRSVMVLHGDTNKTLATFLGISEQSVSNKINENGTEFKKGEIFKKVPEDQLLDALRFELENWSK